MPPSTSAAQHVNAHKPSSSPSPPPHARPPAQSSPARKTPAARARRRSFEHTSSDAEDETFVPDTHDLSEDASSDEDEKAARGATPQEQLQLPPPDLNAEPDWLLDDSDGDDVAEGQLDKLPAQLSRGGEKEVRSRLVGKKRAKSSGRKAASERGAYTRAALERLRQDPRWLDYCHIELDGSYLGKVGVCSATSIVAHAVMLLMPPSAWIVASCSLLYAASMIPMCSNMHYVLPCT